MGRDRIGRESSEAAAAMGARAPLQQPAAGVPARNRTDARRRWGSVPGQPSGHAQAAPDDFPLPFVLTRKMPTFRTSRTTPRRQSDPDRCTAGRGSGPASPLRPRITRHLGAPMTRRAGSYQEKSEAIDIDPTLLELAFRTGITRVDPA